MFPRCITNIQVTKSSVQQRGLITSTQMKGRAGPRKLHYLNVLPATCQHVQYKMNNIVSTIRVLKCLLASLFRQTRKNPFAPESRAFKTQPIQNQPENISHLNYTDRPWTSSNSTEIVSKTVLHKIPNEYSNYTRTSQIYIFLKPNVSCTIHFSFDEHGRDRLSGCCLTSRQVLLR